MSKCESDTKYDRSLLIGLVEIGQYTGFGPQAIRRWIRREGFPAGMLPDGRWCISPAAIDEWLAVRNPYRRLNRELG